LTGTYQNFRHIYSCGVLLIIRVWGENDMQKNGEQKKSCFKTIYIPFAIIPHLCGCLIFFLLRLKAKIYLIKNNIVKRLSFSEMQFKLLGELKRCFDGTVISNNFYRGSDVTESLVE
jgi:hypothetical protein